MQTHPSTAAGQLLHVVTLACKDNEHATRCIDALAHYGKPDALSFNCCSYEFGLQDGTVDTVYTDGKILTPFCTLRLSLRSPCTTNF